MNYELRDKLEKIGALAGSGDELEHDLALQLLREVYAEIKWIPAPEEAKTEPLFDGTAPEGKDCRMPEEPKTAPEPSETEPVSEPKPSIISRRVAPEVIRSLYGSEEDEEAEEDSAPEESKDEPEQIEENHEHDEGGKAPESGSMELAPNGPDLPPVQPSPQLSPTEKPATTLGDAMAAGHRTLGETLGGNNNGRDMASKIAAADRPNLKRSIGLNDRFLMIRDMFDGDAEAFDRVITRLDAFTDFDEAVIWIRDNFDWSAESKGVSLLVALLERKLGR